MQPPYIDSTPRLEHCRLEVLPDQLLTQCRGSGAFRAILRMVAKSNCFSHHEMKPWLKPWRLLVFTGESNQKPGFLNGGAKRISSRGVFSISYITNTQMPSGIWEKRIVIQFVGWLTGHKSNQIAQRNYALLGSICPDPQEGWRVGTVFSLDFLAQTVCPQNRLGQCSAFCICRFGLSRNVLAPPVVLPGIRFLRPVPQHLV